MSTPFSTVNSPHLKDSQDQLAVRLRCLGASSSEPAISSLEVGGGDGCEMGGMETFDFVIMKTLVFQIPPEKGEI